VDHHDLEIRRRTYADFAEFGRPPLSVPTAYRVEADDRSWYANCAWDAIGICAALHADGLIETACPDCGEPIRLRIRDKRPDDESLVFHCLVPARQWWDDIVFT
jgi:hypothetical protein